MHKIRIEVFVMIISIAMIILTGCSIFSSKPNDIRQEIWDTSKSIYKIIMETVKNNREFNDYQNNIITTYIQSNLDNKEKLNLSDAEIKLLMDLYGLYIFGATMNYDREYNSNNLDKDIEIFYRLANDLKILE